MSLTITHNSTADGDPLIDGDDWNANHTITGGGTGLVPQLIESKTLSAESSTTWSGLDGNSDKDYLVVFNYTISGATDRTTYLLPGGATAADFDGGDWYSARTHVCDDYGFVLNSGAYGRGKQYGWLRIKAASGVVRSSAGFRHGIVSATNHGATHPYCTWSDTSTNITSLVLGMSGADLTGTIKLYKLVSLTM